MYTDLITRIRNAQQARKEFVKLMYSNSNFAIAELLAKHNYVDSAAKKGRMPKRIIEIKLRYDSDGRGAIEGSRFVSRSSLRKYVGYRDLREVKQGYGISILSTPQGIMTGKEARRAKVGGELLCEIW
ncbi:MAG: 30S ribosomal protein S8 [Patescibacteria group bacterium]